MDNQVMACSRFCTMAFQLNVYFVNNLEADLRINYDTVGFRVKITSKSISIGFDDRTVIIR